MYAVSMLPRGSMNTRWPPVFRPFPLIGSAHVAAGFAISRPLLVTMKREQALTMKLIHSTISRLVERRQEHNMQGPQLLLVMKAIVVPMPAILMVIQVCRHPPVVVVLSLPRTKVLSEATTTTAATAAAAERVPTLPAMCPQHLTELLDVTGTELGRPRGERVVLAVAAVWTVAGVDLKAAAQPREAEKNDLTFPRCCRLEPRRWMRAWER